MKISYFQSFFIWLKYNFYPLPQICGCINISEHFHGKKRKLKPKIENVLNKIITMFWAGDINKAEISPA
jgi:hypothetical protein